VNLFERLLKLYYMLGAHGFQPVILAAWEPEIGRITVEDQTGQIVVKTPISKITRAKWTGFVAQVVECLLCKPEALSSNSSSVKNK
jgi:hypothetical protein